MKNPHIIFKSIEGKIKAGVEVDGTLIFFKEEKDEERVKRIIWNGLSKQLIEVHGKAGTEEYWQPELDKLYKIEGEIEIREEPIKEKIEGLGGNGLATTIKQFAFIKNDVFDTGARLPEQKEEIKNKINELYEYHSKNTPFDRGVRFALSEIQIFIKS